jgi:hypothetical protein
MIKIVRLGVMSLLGVLLIGALWFLYVNSAVEIVAQVMSPNRKQDAMLLVINPGAMGGYATAVMIEPGSNALWRQMARLNRRRDFVAASNNGAAAVGAKGQLDVSLVWTSNAELTIRFPAKAEVMSQETRHGSVHINYIAR